MRTWTLGVCFAFVACKPAPPPEGDELTFDGPYDRVEVLASAGRVEFAAGTDDTVHMEFLPNTSDTYLTEEGDDGVLRITAVCFGEEVAGCNGGFLMTVGAGQALTAQTQGGEITFLDGLFGTLDAQTASGPILFTNVGAADATLLTGTGEVTARFAEKPSSISFDTGSSLLSVAVPAGRYALDLDTTGAKNVQEGIENGAGPDLRLHSGTGDIDLFVYTGE